MHTDWEKLKAWMSDCAKGLIGAIVATLLLSLCQYIGSHIPEILQFLGKIAAATATVKITKR